MTELFLFIWPLAKLILFTWPLKGRVQKKKKKIMNFLTTPPMEKIKEMKMIYFPETNSIWYGSSDNCQMAPPESLDVKASYLTMILAEEGLPSKKNWKIKFVWKCVLFKFMFFFNNEKNNGKFGRCRPHPPTSRVYKVAGTLIFLPTHLRVLIFSTKSHIS